MPSYTPNNVNVYAAAFTGALSGMGVSGRVLISENSSDYTLVVAIAGAWAQQFDTLWGMNATTQFDVEQIQAMSSDTWKERNTQLQAQLNPTTYTKQCKGLIVLIQTSHAFLMQQGIVPPAIPFGGVATEDNAGGMSAADKAKLDALALPAPAHVDPLGSWLQTPNLIAGQYGSDILIAATPADAGTGKPATVEGLFQLIPDGLVPPYAVEVSLREASPNIVGGYPFMGVAISDGVANGSRAQTIYRYQSSWGVASALQVIGSPYNSGSTHSVADNTHPNFTGATQLNFRIVHDGTYLWYQTSSDGKLWGVWGLAVSYASLLPGGGGTNLHPLTHYGVLVGSSGGPESALAHVTNVRIRSLAKAGIVSAVYDAPTRRGTFTLDAPLNLVSGSSISVQGVHAGGGESPVTNAVPYSAILVIDPTHIVISALNSFSAMPPGGQIIDLTG